METVAILVHSLNRFSLCTKMAAVAVAKLLLCCDIICKRSIEKCEDVGNLRESYNVPHPLFKKQPDMKFGI